MSLDSTAIEQIQESAQLDKLLRQLKENDLGEPIALIPQNMRLESLDCFRTYKTHYELNYNTISIEDFLAYNKEFDEVGATCFVDAESMKAKSIYDLGITAAPGHKKHSASLSLKRTAAFEALLTINGQKLSQRSISEFIEDWNDAITAKSVSGDSMDANKAAQSLRDLTIESARSVNSAVGDFSQTMSEMERIEAKNQEQIAAEIHFSCIPYSGLRERHFIARLSIITSGDVPMISARILKLESIREELAQEFKELITDAAKDLNLKTYIGKA